MERLTEEKQLGPFYSLKDKAEAVPGVFGTYDCFYAHEVAVTRLKEYEDTGLEPDEIRRFLQTGTGGLYKKLPCKEGAPVWWIDVDWLPGNGPMFHKISSGKFRYAMLDWNNPVYTSQADAEAALAKMAKEGTTSEKSDRY